MLNDPDVNLDDVLIEILLYSRHGYSFNQRSVTTEKTDVILGCLKDMKVFDSAPREFESIDFEYDIRMSSSCFAQMKRHRMMTLIPQAYSNSNLVVVPESVKASGLEKKFMEVITETNYAFEKMFMHNDGALKWVCPYILTNSHTRKVYAKINGREMFHFCRMREDGHAQWEIRELATQMKDLAAKVAPITMKLCCGKDKFEQTYNKVIGENV